jgi:hypothetical protein
MNCFKRVTKNVKGRFIIFILDYLYRTDLVTKKANETYYLSRQTSINSAYWSIRNYKEYILYRSTFMDTIAKSDKLLTRNQPLFFFLRVRIVISNVSFVRHLRLEFCSQNKRGWEGWMVVRLDR